MINSLKHIRKQFEQAWRHWAGDPDDDEEDHGEYSHVKDSDIKAIVGALKWHSERIERNERRSYVLAAPVRVRTRARSFINSPGESGVLWRCGAVYSPKCL